MYVVVEEYLDSEHGGTTAVVVGPWFSSLAADAYLVHSEADRKSVAILTEVD